MGHKINSHIDEIVANTRYWVKSTVIHYNLCPFANKVFVSDRLQIDVSDATTEEQLLGDCLFAIQQLLKTSRDKTETMLLVHPECMNDFNEYNNFLGAVDELLQEMELLGVIQVASFHPNYCFADCDDNDAANFTNRSPYPMLHLLREESVSEAVEEWSLRNLDIEEIPNRNIETLRKLGRDVLAGQLLACYKKPD